jgi:hypothetical protein
MALYSLMVSPSLNVPILAARPNNITAVSVSIDGGPAVQLDMLENMAKVTEQTYNGKFSQTLVKTAIRTMRKYVPAFIAAKTASDAAGGGMLGDAAGTASLTAVQKAMEATEVPDLRGTRYLPGKAWVGGVTVPPGRHHVSVTFSDGTVREFPDVEVKAGKLNILEAINLR